MILVPNLPIYLVPSLRPDNTSIIYNTSLTLLNDEDKLTNLDSADEFYVLEKIKKLCKCRLQFPALEIQTDQTNSTNLSLPQYLQ